MTHGLSRRDFAAVAQHQERWSSSITGSTLRAHARCLPWQRGCQNSYPASLYGTLLVFATLSHVYQKSSRRESWLPAPPPRYINPSPPAALLLSSCTQSLRYFTETDPRQLHVLAPSGVSIIVHVHSYDLRSVERNHKSVYHQYIC
jgi:hypothetical protein